MQPDELANELPAPRDDEPASLRQDIVDELADHLQCARGRERNRTGDDATAEKNVLERFGNPAKVAYRLWFDGMKERIMGQRITLVAGGDSGGGGESCRRRGGVGDVARQP